MTWMAAQAVLQSPVSGWTEHFNYLKYVGGGGDGGGGERRACCGSSESVAGNTFFKFTHLCSHTTHTHTHTYTHTTLARIMLVYIFILLPGQEFAAVEYSIEYVELTL